MSMAKKPVKYYVVDAFTDSAFKGNPAAVCLLEQEREESWLQSLAAEFNISETCYLTPIHETTSKSNPPRFHLRWFTPLREVNLCGHATLAAAHTLFSSGLVNTNIIQFLTLSGVLTATKITKLPNSEALEVEDNGFYVELDFPADPIIEYNPVDSSLISGALNGAYITDIKRTQFGDNLLDPVCGSAHCALASYWSKTLGKCDFNAYQASARGGALNIHIDEEKQRVFLRGKAVTVMEGSVLV